MTFLAPFLFLRDDEGLGQHGSLGTGLEAMFYVRSTKTNNPLGNIYRVWSNCVSPHLLVILIVDHHPSLGQVTCSSSGYVPAGWVSPTPYQIIDFPLKWKGSGLKRGNKSLASDSLTPVTLLLTAIPLSFKFITYVDGKARDGLERTRLGFFPCRT